MINIQNINVSYGSKLNLCFYFDVNIILKKISNIDIRFRFNYFKYNYIIYDMSFDINNYTIINNINYKIFELF